MIGPPRIAIAIRGGRASVGSVRPRRAALGHCRAPRPSFGAEGVRGLLNVTIWVFHIPVTCSLFRESLIACMLISRSCAIM